MFLLDSADVYGRGHNEKIIGEVLREGDNRSKVFLITKFGVRWDLPQGVTIDGSPAYAKKAIQDSIDRMGGVHPDVWILHRIDKNTPIEESVKAMDALRKEGKCKYIGLSEVSLNFSLCFPFPMILTLIDLRSRSARFRL